MSANGNEGVKGACAICGRAIVERFVPFCSRRCADVDLGRWFKGSYAIPGRPMDVIDGGGGDED